MVRFHLASQMCLVEDGEDLLADLEAGRLGEDNGAAHVGAGDESRWLGTGRRMVVVEAHYHFCIAVVEGDCVDLHQDFALPWNREGRAGQSEIRDSGLGGEPLKAFGREGHYFCCCCGGCEVKRERETGRKGDRGKRREERR